MTTDERQLHQVARKIEQSRDLSSVTHYFDLFNASQDPIYKLYLATFLHHIGEKEAGTALLINLFDSNLYLFYLWNNNSLSQMTRARSHYAFRLVTEAYTQLHEMAMEEIMASARIKKSVWVQTHNKKIQFPSDFQRPQLFFIPELSNQAVWRGQDLSEIAPLLESATSIQKEISSHLEDLSGTKRSYIGSHEVLLPKEFTPLVGTDNWTAVDLYRNGQPNNDTLRKLPFTDKILSELPTYNLGDFPFEVFISGLRSQQKIPPHFGQSNHSLTVHLPVDIPRGCEIRVSQKKYHWELGTPFIFDDTFVHEARNNSEQTRVVLLLSIWHPELNIAECEAIKYSFNRRQNFTQTQITKEKQFLSAYLNSTGR